MKEKLLRNATLIPFPVPGFSKGLTKIQIYHFLTHFIYSCSHFPEVVNDADKNLNILK